MAREITVRASDIVRLVVLGILTLLFVLYLLFYLKVQWDCRNVSC